LIPGWNTNCPHGVVYSVPESLQEIAGLAPQLCSSCILPHPFQLVMHQSSYHSTLYNLDPDTVIKRKKKTPKSETWVSALGHLLRFCVTHPVNCQLVQLMQYPSHNPTGESQALLRRDMLRAYPLIWKVGI
jgi:hypothetical protein